MKRIIAPIVGFVASIGLLNAAIVSTNFPAAGEHLLLGTNDVTVSQIQITTGATGGTFRLYDSASLTTNYITAAYTNSVSFMTNIESSVVTSSGITNLYTNSVLWTADSAVSAATNELPRVVDYAVPANSTVIYSGLNLNFARGVVAYANHGTNTLTLTYQSLR